MSDYRIVKSGEITIGYIITEYDMDDGTKSYDWRTDFDESDEWSFSAEEAEDEVKRRFG